MSAPTSRLCLASHSEGAGTGMLQGGPDLGKLGLQSCLPGGEHWGCPLPLPPSPGSALLAHFYVLLGPASI